MKKHAATLGISDETATDFWYLFDGQGWRTKGGAFIYNWRSLLTSFNRGRKRLEMGDAKRQAHIDAKMDERSEKLTAHIDAKMDERERKRERRSGGGRKKADNYIASTPEQVKEFTDGL